MKLIGSLIIGSLSLYGSQENSPLRAKLNEETRLKVGRELIIETGTGEIHLDLRIKLNIRRENKEIVVRYELENEGELLSSIPRIYGWD